MRVEATDERFLIQRARDGSEAACRELVEASWARCWKAAMAITMSSALTEEVCQDAFERAFSRLDTFDGSRPFAAWVERIAINRAIDVIRSEQRRVDREQRTVEPIATEMPEPVDQALATAVQELDPGFREVVALRFGLDHTPAQIADALGLSEGTVKSRLARALERLRSQLGAAR